jgi:SAM-dependent methyltransferase
MIGQKISEIYLFVYKTKKLIKHRNLFYKFRFIEHYKNKKKTSRNKKINQKKYNRRLEIGPGKSRLSGFETINIVNGDQVDYILDASKSLPFEDNSFDIIYASHVLEHIPWYETDATLKEWIRILKPEGTLEIWVPDGLKICQVFIDNSLGNLNTRYKDGWKILNSQEDPFYWVAGRLFYGANLNYPSWHKAIFSAKSLTELLIKTGLTQVREMSIDEYRGDHDHGWINLGVIGKKP